MPDTDLHNLSQLLAEIEGISINTSQGSFVKVEDVRRLIDKKRGTERPTSEDLKTVEQARAAIRRDPDLLKAFANAPQEAGRAVPASEPQSSSRT